MGGGLGTIWSGFSDKNVLIRIHSGLNESPIKVEVRRAVLIIFWN